MYPGNYQQNGAPPHPNGQQDPQAYNQQYAQSYNQPPPNGMPQPTTSGTSQQNPMQSTNSGQPSQLFPSMITQQLQSFFMPQSSNAQNQAQQPQYSQNQQPPYYQQQPYMQNQEPQYAQNQQPQHGQNQQQQSFYSQPSSTQLNAQSQGQQPQYSQNQQPPYYQQQSYMQNQEPQYAQNQQPQHGQNQQQQSFYSEPSSTHLNAQQQQSMQQQASNFQGSNCSGNKKALLIGINYFGQQSELKGCINDVKNMRAFLGNYGFLSDQQHMVLLTDDQSDPDFQPTHRSIMNAIAWLVGGARPGDSLFLHYSGHGGLVKDTSGDSIDGNDCCIYPSDHQRAGPIIDDNLNRAAVRTLPTGVRLTVIFDCCHNGTGLDLPYVYNHDGTLKRFSPEKLIYSELTSAAQNFMAHGASKGMMGLFSSAQNMMKMNLGQASQIEQNNQRERSTMADVIMFSGCKNGQTSADTFISGVGSTGAMSYAFIKALKDQPNQSMLNLLANVRAILNQKYSQKPQLSTGHPMDMNVGFFL